MNVTTATPFAAFTSFRTVFSRAVRTVVQNTYNAETRSIESGTRGEYYATAEIGYIGKETDGTWSLLTTDGARITSGHPNRGSGMVAARRHFGSDIMFG